jgi:hypothetical protein
VRHISDSQGIRGRSRGPTSDVCWATGGARLHCDHVGTSAQALLSFDMDNPLQSVTIVVGELRGRQALGF